MVKAIASLPTDQWFEYINPKNKGKVKVVSVTKPEGPIIIKRADSKKNESISSKMIWRLANAMQPDIPVNVDRVFAGSYNTRSVLETLLAHTPEFYWCTPGRIELENSTQEIKSGHKHIVWRPNSLHKNGVLQKFETDVVISEIPSTNAIYESLQMPSVIVQGITDINVQRRHLQIQIALVAIGHQLGFRTWVARNDQGIRYGNKKVGELDGIVVQLEQENLMKAWADAVKAATHIDCIWFRNGKFMPAVMEVEHSTGVVTGLARMKRLKDQLPSFQTRWVIVAPDEDRGKVIKEANEPQFHDLHTMFFPYSAVDELYALCQKRKLSNKAVTEAFLDCFMEPCIPVSTLLQLQ
ncbi:MAG: restriction endonuclease [Burkholderiales bacterium]|nr:restriction endonuclease [Burkholderiales bacterium]